MFHHEDESETFRLPPLELLRIAARLLPSEWTRHPVNVTRSKAGPVRRAQKALAPVY
jgi:hypothetical protein